MPTPAKQVTEQRRAVETVCGNAEAPFIPFGKETAIRIVLSWICYWVGDAISRTIEPFFGKWFEWPYRVYSKFMVWSFDLQGDDPRGPWSVKPESN